MEQHDLYRFLYPLGLAEVNSTLALLRDKSLVHTDQNRRKRRLIFHLNSLKSKVPPNLTDWPVALY